MPEVIFRFSTQVSIKRFFGNISFVVLLNLLVKPGWVLVENMVQDRIGNATFGIVTAVISLASIVAVLSDLGLTHFSVKRLASEPGFMAEYFPTILPLRAGLSVLSLGLMLVVGAVLGYDSTRLTVLAIIGTSLLFAQYSQFLRGTLQASQRFNADALLSVLEKALLLLLVVVCLPIGLTLERYVWARLVAAGFSALLLYGIMARLFGRVPYRYRWGQARELLRQSLPFALITVLYGVNERIDMVMLERLASPAEAGYYAGAYRWVDAVMMYAWTVLPLFFAKFSAASNNREEQRELLWFGQRVVTIPLLLIVAFVLFQGERLFWQFGQSSPAELARMTWCAKILFINVLVHAFFAIYASLLNSTGQVHIVSRLVVLSIVLNVGANLLTLSRYGAVAAAWNTLLCVAVMSVGYVVLVHRAGVAVPWSLLARLLAAFVGLCATWQVLQLYAGLPWLLESAVAAAVFGGLLLALRIVKLAELRRLRP